MLELEISCKLIVNSEIGEKTKNMYKSPSVMSSMIPGYGSLSYVTTHHFPTRSSVISSIGQRVPSHPELKVEWLPSSRAVDSAVPPSLPGCAGGPMLMDDSWKQGQMASLR